MQTRCCNCFALYNNVDGMCPHCGHSEGDSAKEIYYLSPGTVLVSETGTEYIIGEAIGAGGFGIIYKAWDDKLERKVAIKEYFPPSMVTRGVGEQKVAIFSNKKAAEYNKGLHNFLQEATIMSLCADCDNVCNSYDRFEANGTAYMVMEFLNGKTLKSYVAERNGELLEESEVLSIIIQSLKGLEEIHNRGIVHLDIAPDNIYVMPDGKIKIADFGAAKSKKVKKDEDEIVLKPGFAPPEQYRQNEKLGPEADIYAMGANLYWLLTGQVPLEATDREFEDTLEEPAMLQMVSPSVNNVTMRAMAVKKELRYKNSREFIADLNKEMVRGVQEELKRRKKNRRNFLLAFSITLILVILGVTYFGFNKNRLNKDSIVVWVAVENQDISFVDEKNRYEEVVDMFNRTYPQIEVDIMVKKAGNIESDYLKTSPEDRPDLIETTSFSNNTMDEFIKLGSVRERSKESFLKGLEIKKIASCSVPVGIYISITYAGQGDTSSSSTQNVDYETFLLNKQGKCESDSSKYLQVQDKMAGQYQLLESKNKVIYLAEEFSVYKRSVNKANAAKAFLEYMLTDAAQDVLHIRNQSGYMPVINEVWHEYIDVYSEFEFVRDNIASYSTKERNY